MIDLMKHNLWVKSNLFLKCDYNRKILCSESDMH